MDRDGGRRVSIASRPLSPQLRWSSQHHAKDAFRSNRSVSLPLNQSDKPNTPTPSKERTQKNTTALVQPSSSLLQDLIKERREYRGFQNSASESKDGGAFTISGQRLPQDEDNASEEQKANDNTASASFRNSAPTGLRETDEYVSKITKLNFDLKLQIWHREQQVETLTKKLHRTQGIEERVRRMYQLENDLKKLRNAAKENQSLKQSHSELRRDVEKRDQAITEAVELICQLEARVEELEAGHVSNQSTPQATKPRGSDLAKCALPTPESQTTVDIPDIDCFGLDQSGSPRLQSLKSLSPLKRAPSFLREDSKNTATLRSLCNNFSHTTLNALSRSESLFSDDIADPASPRLSTLSECSEFLPESPTVLARFENETNPIRKQPLGSANSGPYGSEDKDARVDCWKGSREDALQATSPKQRFREAPATAHPTIIEDDKLLKGFKVPSRQYCGKDVIYCGTRLPPTPDTMSSTHEISTIVPNGITTTAARRQRDAALFAGHEFGRPRSAGVVTAGRRRSLESTSGEDTRGRVNVGIYSDIPMTPCMATPLPFDREIAGNLTSDFGERPSTSSTSATFEHHNIRPTVSSHSLRDENFILNRADIYPLASTARKRRFTLPSQMPAPECYSPEMDNPPRPLETEDWLEAAKQGPVSQSAPSLNENSNQTSIEATDCSPSRHSHITNKRIPSQSPSPAHRHTSQLESSLKRCSTKGTPEPERRRRNWLSRLFHRSRRAEPSSSDYSYSVEEGCSAPSPVIRKTRHTIYFD